MTQSAVKTHLQELRMCPVKSRKYSSHHKAGSTNTMNRAPASRSRVCTVDHSAARVQTSPGHVPSKHATRTADLVDQHTPLPTRDTPPQQRHTPRNLPLLFVFFLIAAPLVYRRKTPRQNSSLLG